MLSKYSIPFLLICLLGIAGSAQTKYSESAEYRPRLVDAPKKDRKKKSGEIDKVPAVPVSNIADITVTIPLTVLDRSGSAVVGLKREEVSVFVEGAEVPIVGFGSEQEPTTMILVLDSSPSATSSFKTVQEQASKLIGDLPSNMKVMVVDFNSNLNVRSQPTTNRDETRSAISKVKIGDGTSLYTAMHFIYERLLPQVTGRKFVVLMTDGVDTTSYKSNFAKSLTEVEKKDVTIYPVYVDTYRDITRRRTPPNDLIAQVMDQLNAKATSSAESEYKIGSLYLSDLAAASGGRVFSSEKLSERTKPLLEELANRYYVTIVVPRKNAASRPLRVRVNRPALTVVGRGSFVEN